jgi:hypothetical protein
LPVLLQSVVGSSAVVGVSSLVPFKAVYSLHRVRVLNKT